MSLWWRLSFSLNERKTYMYNLCDNINNSKFWFLLVGWLVVFHVPSTVRSFRDGNPIYCPLRRMWSSVFTPFPPGIEPGTVTWQSMTLLLCHTSSDIWLLYFSLTLSWGITHDQNNIQSYLKYLYNFPEIQGQLKDPPKIKRSPHTFWIFPPKTFNFRLFFWMDNNICPRIT